MIYQNQTISNDTVHSCIKSSNFFVFLCVTHILVMHLNYLIFRTIIYIYMITGKIHFHRCTLTDSYVKISQHIGALWHIIYDQLGIKLTRNKNNAKFIYFEREQNGRRYKIERQNDSKLYKRNLWERPELWILQLLSFPDDLVDVCLHQFSDLKYLGGFKR